MVAALASPARSGALPQSERRRQAILDAALRVIAEGGVDAVTHRRVASEAAVPLGSTTYYFASREDLLRDTFHHYVAGVFSALAALEGEMPIASAAGVVEFLVELARREFSDASLLRVEYEFILRAARDQALAREFNAFERALTARLAEALERLGATRAIEAARIVIDLFRGFELERFTRPEIDVEDLRPRLAVVVGALIGATAAGDRAERADTLPAASAARAPASIAERAPAAGADRPPAPSTDPAPAASEIAADVTASTTTDPRRTNDGNRAPSRNQRRGRRGDRARA
jgi:DNA-binding transcriptional regulator YbjK